MKIGNDVTDTFIMLFLMMFVLMGGILWIAFDQRALRTEQERAAEERDTLFTTLYNVNHRQIVTEDIPGVVCYREDS
jgi:cell division protein FtsL